MIRFFDIMAGRQREPKRFQDDIDGLTAACLPRQYAEIARRSRDRLASLADKLAALDAAPAVPSLPATGRQADGTSQDEA